MFLLSGSGLHAQQERPFRIGVQVGVTAGQNRYTWLSSGEQRSTMDEEVRQNGYAGFILEYHVAPKLVLEFSPHHGQRNTPISTMQRLGGVNYALSQDPVEYLGIPMLGKYFPIATGLLRPYAGVGVEFGMNLTALTMMIEEHRISDEPVRKSTIRRRRNLNQLYSALLAEAGLDISASSRVAVLLGVRYTMELTPLLRDDLLTWEAPDVWRIRFALLFRFGGGQ
ncbi:MAG: outer membrane beta-barrel protein [Bacteroidetes bacterium]|nr:outer membrane beta-barrel protein [Bacteroidota bacterium]